MWRSSHPPRLLRPLPSPAPGLARRDARQDVPVPERPGDPAPVARNGSATASVLPPPASEPLPCWGQQRSPAPEPSSNGQFRHSSSVPAVRSPPGADGMPMRWPGPTPKGKNAGECPAAGGLQCCAASPSVAAICAQYGRCISPPGQSAGCSIRDSRRRPGESATAEPILGKPCRNSPSAAVLAPCIYESI